MSNVGREGRSFQRITPDDLRRLASIAAADRAEFFGKHQAWAGLYESRFLAAALCQGAALHYLYGGVGVQDFDVYSFYAAHPNRPWYAKRNKHCDFGRPKFGRSSDCPDMVGRRVDLLGRGIDYRPGEDRAEAIRRWLREGRTQSARLLAEKAVILIEPLKRLGEQVWRPTTEL
jgi:hypothetical protein